MDGLGPPKTFKNKLFFKVFANADFRYVEALLMVLLGPSWLLLGRSGAKMNPKMGSQMAPNRFKMDHNGELGAQEFPARGL